ncbi:MAG: UDP-N-acetylmuramoyl-L-alanine--D-glutamate ligase, partial [Alphaproteobacteria bacterium]|nr:UDP-N-acetylmuramoyl-L-alanine--D-glutamate ligase [Alphaproteobacteria bacterium]
MDLKTKHVLVVGFGKTGQSVARFLKDKVESLAVWDDSEKGQKAIREAGYVLSKSLEKIDHILWSPGIPHYAPQPNPIAVEAKKKKIPLICDIDLFYQLNPRAKYIGITGSNGKSTTVSLLKHIFESLKKFVYLAGNIGTPIFDLPKVKASDFVILELSSYQLELCPNLKLKIGGLLNITPDHLARHDGMKKYSEAKENILKMAEKKILCLDTPDAEKLAEKYNVTPVSTEKEVAGGVYTKDSYLVNNLSGKSRRYLNLNDVPYLKGKHNAQNIAMAFSVAKLAKLCGRRTSQAIKTFKGLAHRQEFVKSENGLTYINDSKATNAEAVEPALKTFENIYLIAGGQAKEGGVKEILPLIQEKVKHVFLIGQAMDLFANQIGSLIPVTKSTMLSQAVKDATTQAYADIQSHKIKSATILLSPACASWDQFDSFEARG